jgi:hypothetical protein
MIIAKLQIQYTLEIEFFCYKRTPGKTMYQQVLEIGFFVNF